LAPRDVVRAGATVAVPAFVFGLLATGAALGTAASCVGASVAVGSEGVGSGRGMVADAAAGSPTAVAAGIAAAAEPPPRMTATLVAAPPMRRSAAPAASTRLGNRCTGGGGSSPNEPGVPLVDATTFAR
jgi:hypothetical protein